MLRTLIVVFFGVVAQLAHGQPVPLPNTIDGFVQGELTAQVMIAGLV